MTKFVVRSVFGHYMSLYRRYTLNIAEDQIYPTVRFGTVACGR